MSALTVSFTFCPCSDEVLEDKEFEVVGAEENDMEIKNRKRKASPIPDMDRDRKKMRSGTGSSATVTLEV